MRNLLVWVNERRYGGVVPGIYRILARDLNTLIPTGWLYNYLHMRKSSPLSRLQRETLATTWPRYDLDLKTWALLSYAKKLTQEPSMMEDSDVEALREAGWDEQGIYEATALISFFNFTGRMEAASGLPMDQIPQGARFPEATAGKPTVSARV